MPKRKSEGEYGDATSDLIVNLSLAALALYTWWSSLVALRIL